MACTWTVRKQKLSKYSNPTTTKVNYYTCLHAVKTIPQTVCLGYSWSDNLSARQGVRSNIIKARRQFIALGSSGCFLGFSNPLSAREVVETCVIPTLLNEAENWILDEACLELLESFRLKLVVGYSNSQLTAISSHWSVLAINYLQDTVAEVKLSVSPVDFWWWLHCHQNL